MSDIKDWKLVDNENVAPINQGPDSFNLHAIARAFRTIQGAIRRFLGNNGFIDLGYVPAFIDAGSFSVSGDQTGAFSTGRRIKITDSSIWYGSIAGAVFGSGITTVSVTLDSGEITSGISAIELGIVDLLSAPASGGGTGTGSAVDEKSLSQPGTLRLLTGNLRWYPTRSITIQSITPNVGTPSIGADILIVVKKNGANILASNLTVPASLNRGEAQVPVDNTLTVDDYLTIDVIQVGSAVAGENLLINFKYS